MSGKKEMYTDETKGVLQKRFTKFDGWEIFYRPKMGKVVPDFLCELALEEKKYRVIVNIKSESMVSQSDVKKIANGAKSLAGKDIVIFAKILVVPSNVTIPATIQKSIESNKIEVLYLKGV